MLYLGTLTGRSSSNSFSISQCVVPLGQSKHVLLLLARQLDDMFQQRIW
jgi:hypothetical protein